jgi:hypothetical protein
MVKLVNSTARRPEAELKAPYNVNTGEVLDGFPVSVEELMQLPGMLYGGGAGVFMC